MSSEKFVIETAGGPHPGSRIVPADLFPWPLPETLPMDPTVNYGGSYMKLSEGTATPYENKERVLKAARYSWVSGI